MLSIYKLSASLHSGLVGCVSRRSWEDTDTHQAGCKNLLSDFRIGKVCGYHKKPGILSLFWPTVDWGVLSCLFLSPPFWKPVSLSADISISDQAWQKLARRTAALFAFYGAVLASVWPYYLSAGTACINITLTLLESISDQAWQKLARRTAALFAVYGAVLASAWPYQEHRHNTWLSKLWGLEPAGQAKLVTNEAEVGGGCLGFRGVAVKWIRCNPALKVSEVCMKSLGTIDILRACLVHNVHHALVCRTL